jgi:S1-C subfamily serine protease
MFLFPSARRVRAIVGLAVLALATAALLSPALRAARPEGSKADARAKPGVVDDLQILRSLETQAARLLETGKTTPASDLVAQLGRASCDVQLAKPSGKPLAPEELYERSRKSVLIVAGLFKCEKCSRNHVAPATGFVIGESGVAVTNHHVVNDPKNLTLVAMTVDGAVCAVKAVLAASAAHDVAILQLDASGLVPLAIGPRAAVGSDVFVISHPARRFYTLSRGMVARYGTVVRERQKSTLLQITAPYAKGSSGGPVLNTAGEVVGMASSTVSVYYGEDHGKPEDFQMAFDQCVPAEQILELIRAK